MNDHGGEAAKSTYVRVGQAVYTWAKGLPPRPAGYRFVTVSPEWEARRPWLEASTHSITGFVGNDQPVSARERESYLPVGRHVHGGKALAYHKQDAGLDGNNRPGNYVVHFLIADVWHFSLTDVLTMPDQWWIAAAEARLNLDLRLADVELSRIRDTLPEKSEARATDAFRIIQAIRELARKKSVSADDWVHEDMLALLATLPPWADHAMRLIPEWSERGPSQHLALRDIPPSGEETEDRRWLVQGDELEELRERLSGAGSLAEIGHIVSERTPALLHDRENIQAQRLDSATLKWITNGSKGLAPAEVDLLKSEPGKTLGVLDERRRKIPSTRRLDPIALSLLERCDGINRGLLARVLPIDDEAVSAYATGCPNIPVLEAAMLLNCDGSRTIDLVLLRDVPPATMHHLVEMSKADPDIFDGLVRSVRISSLRGGTFARRLLLSDGMDFDYLYMKILPAVAKGRIDSLLSLACINAEAFVSWTEIPEPYAEALIEALRHETRQALWERISGFFGRWKAPWPARRGR